MRGSAWSENRLTLAGMRLLVASVRGEPAEVFRSLASLFQAAVFCLEVNA